MKKNQNPIKNKDTNEITESEIDVVLLEIKKAALVKMKKGNKSKFPFNSMTEAVGKLTEEYFEVIEEVRKENENRFKSEIKDVAIVCIRSLIKKIDKK
jgi:NTP pyrophosphatase (non-canonical NTP hydrolase)